MRKIPLPDFLQPILAAVLIVAFLAVAIQPAIASSPSQHPQPNTVRFENISVKDGLSHETVQAILQDREGYMWFGTLDGLNKYNGYEISIYRHDPNNASSLLDNNVLALYEDSKGRLWIGTGRGLDMFNRRSRTFSHYQQDNRNSDSLNGRKVTVILEDLTGLIWVGTSNSGLNFFNPETNHFIHYTNRPNDPGSLSSNAIQAIYQDRKGQLWVGTVNGLNLFNRSQGTFTRFQHNPEDSQSLSAPSVTAIEEDQMGRLWIGTQGGGLDLFDPETQSFTHFQNNPNRPSTISGNLVNTIFTTRNGSMWIGSDGGLDVFSTQQFTIRHYSQLPPNSGRQGDETVNAIFEDETGILWIASSLGGVSKYNPATEIFNLYKYAPDQLNTLSSNDISAICETAGGTLWVGTYNGGLNRVNRTTNSIATFRHNPDNPGSIADDEIRVLMEDQYGTLWIGTAQGGLDWYDPDARSFHHLAHAPAIINSLSENQITALFEDRSGAIWVGTYNTGLNRLNRTTETFEHYTHIPDYEYSLSDDHILSIYEDRTGKLWIGTWGGINVYDPILGRFTHYEHNADDPSSLSENMVLAFLEDQTGVMWIATNGGGLNRFNAEMGTFTAYTELDGLPNDAVFGILPAPDGTLWLSTSRGLSQFNPQKQTFRNFDSRDGLQGNQFNPGAFYISKNSEMFFGGNQGLNAFYPLEVQPNPHAPSVVITRLSTLDHIVSTSITANERFQFPYDENFLSIEFAALDYSIPEKNQYAYMLEGVDKDWIYTHPSRRYESQTNIFEGVFRDWYYAPARRVVDYANLKPGKYIFHVKGSNNDEVWNEEGVAIYITITPPLWERGWFQIVSGLGLFSLLAIAWVFRSRWTEHRRQLLETEVEERTFAIERRQRVAEGLRDILTIINTDQPLDEILNFIVIQATDLLESEGCAIHSFDQERNIAVIQSRYGLPSELDALERYLLGADRRTQAILNHDHFANPDISAALAQENNLDRTWQETIGKIYQACLTVPLIVRENVYGSLTFFYAKARNFSQDDLEIASDFAEHAALAIENANLRSLAEQTAVAAERSRLARDLHDAVTQTLFSASLIAEVIPRIWETDPSEGKQLLQDLRQLTQGALAEMRSLLLELRPATLAELDLSDLLKQLSDAFSGRTDVPVELKIEGTLEIPPTVQTALYRITQEALNNIAKHARATLIEIHLTRLDGCVELYITDNGIGFDTAHITPDHFGLKIMRERAENIGATFLITSIPNHGTKIVVNCLREKPC